jgi:molecular chaperone DnaK
MVRDAESHAEEDRRRREEADVRNNADNLVYSIERSLKDVDGKVDPNTKLEIEQAIKETKEALAGGDVEEIKQKQEALLSASHKLSEVLYQQAQDQQQASSAGATDAESPDDVVEDAEIVDDEDEERR